jgi:hypothetical protein
VGEGGLCGGARPIVEAGSGQLAGLLIYERGYEGCCGGDRGRVVKHGGRSEGDSGGGYGHVCRSRLCRLLMALWSLFHGSGAFIETGCRTRGLDLDLRRAIVAAEYVRNENEDESDAQQKERGRSDRLIRQ